MFEVDLAGADGVDGGGAAAEGALAGLLWSGVHGLPSSVAGRQVRSRHPAVIPHVEVPVWDVTFEAQSWRKKNLECGINVFCSDSASVNTVHKVYTVGRVG